VFGSADEEKTKEVLAKYKVQSLNAFLGKEKAKTEASTPKLPPFNPKMVSNVEFITYFNALMSQGNIHEDDKALFQKFAQLGIEPGKDFNSSSLDSAIVNAINEGIASAMQKIEDESMKLGVRKNGWQLVANVFGNREAMKGKTLTRAAAAYFGLWGNDLEEAFYPEATFDADGDELDGSKYSYELHFEADNLPPVKAFWSLSMYKLPEQLFIENEINRYVISSATDGLKYNDDGSLDVYIQKENPGADKASNWLPAYNGKFSLQARLYWPEPSALNPLYEMPAIRKNN
jgi:hypothetical protein